MKSGWIALFVTFLTAAPARAELSVVATLPDLAALAKAVGRDAVEVTTLASPSEDPHYVDPKPSLMLPLRRADFLIVNGLGLEVGWLPPLQTGARNADIQTGGAGYFDASRYVERTQVPTGKIDRSMGDVHPGGNPHFSFAPAQCARIVRALGEKMAELDPERAEHYRGRARDYAKKLEGFATGQAERFRKLPAAQRRVVVYHRSFAYLRQWLGLDSVAEIEPRPGIPPNPGHVAKVLKKIRSEKAGVILQEEHYPKNTANTLAKLAGIDVVVVQTATRFEEGQTYLEHARAIAEELYDALR